MFARQIALTVLFVASFGYYLYGMSPTVSVGDSGEFITAARTLGIPHPPAFPTYVISAHTFSSLIPWGNPAYRVNLFSVFCGALAVTVVFDILFLANVGMHGAFFGALLLLFSKTMILTGRGSEVFALHGLLVAAVFHSLLNRQWALAALWFALGMGNHQTMLFVLPGAIVYAVMAKVRPTAAQWPRIALGLSAGLVVYFLVYVRAGQHPFINMGHADTFDRLWRVIMRADYGTLTLALGDAPQRTLGTTLFHLERFIIGVVNQIGWAGWFLVLFGAQAWYKKDRPKAMLFIVSFIILGPWFYWFGNLPFDAQSTGLLERFYVAPMVCAALMAAMALNVAETNWPWFAWIMVFFPFTLAIRPAEATNLRNDFVAYSYGMNNLRTLPPSSVFVMDGGDDTFYTLAYLTHVEQRRSDVQFYDRGGVVFPGLYGPDFRLLDADDKAKRRTDVEQSVLSGGHPLVYSTMNPEILPGVTLQETGILYRADKAAASAVPMSYALYDLRGIAPWLAFATEPITDYRSRALTPFYAYQEAVAAGRREDWSAALHWLETAHQIGPDVVWLEPNIEHSASVFGFTCFQKGLFDQALGFYKWLVVINRQDAQSWINIGAIADRQNRIDDAEKAYQRSLEIQPQSALAHFNLSVCYWKQKQWSKVVSELDQVLAIDASYPGAAAYRHQAEARAAHP